MAHTYADTLATDKDKVRFYIRDVERDAGPLPDNANFEDAELTALITTEGSWQRAVAGCFDILASAWATSADLVAGSRREDFSQISARYQMMAEDWRRRHGSSSGGAGSRHPTRVDGYSSDVASDTV